MKSGLLSNRFRIASVDHPIEGGAPVWYIETDLVTKEILLALLDKVLTNKSLPGREVFQQNILEALSELG